jgi:hypothetical protein
VQVLGDWLGYDEAAVDALMADGALQKDDELLSD